MPYVLDRSTGQTSTPHGGSPQKKSTKAAKPKSKQKRKGTSGDMSDSQQKLILVGLAAVIVVALLFTGWYLFGGSHNSSAVPPTPLAGPVAAPGARGAAPGPVLPPPAGLSTQPNVGGQPMRTPGPPRGMSRPMQGEQPASTESEDTDNGIH